MPRRPKAVPAETWVKRTVYFHSDEAEELRLRAFTERRTQAEMVREAVRRYLGMDDH